MQKALILLDICRHVTHVVTLTYPGYKQLTALQQVMREFAACMLAANGDNMVEAARLLQVFVRVLTRSVGPDCLQ